MSLGEVPPIEELSPLLFVVRALAFAAEHHTDQRRKGQRAQPYLNHLVDVARLVGEATQGTDPALVAAALLHDVVEDQEVTIEEVIATFGDDVGALVAAVTDDKALPYGERKAGQVQRAPNLTNRAKLLKLCDKIANLRSLAEDPPADWETKRAEEYVAWCREVVKGLRGVDASLEQAFDVAAVEALGAISARSEVP